MYIIFIIHLIMKTQVTLTIDADIKEKLQKIAKQKWTNMSTLANMYFIKVVNTGEIDYYNDNESVEMWEISIEELSEEDLKKIEDIDKRDISSFINI
jgi:antitoxin component of RelBE/YafQ-DinJ toxin-antitoxin module